MTKRKPSWETIAKKVLGKSAVQNIGDGSRGQFILVTPCRDVGFSLWKSKAGLRHGRVGWTEGGAAVGAARGLIKLLISR